MVITKELSVFMRDMEPRNHVVLFYDTLESKRSILLNFIADGLENQKGIVYICSDESPEQIRNAMGAFGIDIGANEGAGRLLIHNYDEWYIEGGRAETLKIITRWNETYEEFRDKGLGLRGIGETSCFFKQNMVRELLRYEYALHKILTIPMEAICVYSLQTIVNTGYTEMIMPLIRAHGKVIFTAQGGSMVIEPDAVEASDVESLLDIKI